VESLVPRSGRILEIGCGHGLFCTYLALAARSRTVRGSDIDEPKIEQARAVAARLTGLDLQFDVATSGAVAPGPWDAIVIIDMLYLLPAADQRKLLADAVTQLGPDGVLLIKEMSAAPRWKARWNVLQETLSVSILGITERAESKVPGSGSARFDFVAPGVMAGWLTELGLRTSGRRLDRHRVHPHHVLIAQRG